MIYALLHRPFSFPAVIATLLGLLFPLFALALLLWHGDMTLSWQSIADLHDENFALFIIWTAPLVLGVFGYFLGKTSLLLQQQMDYLRRQTAELNTILDTAGSAIITIDTCGNITNFNKAAEQIFGYSRDEIIGKNVSCLMPEPIAAQHSGYLKRYLHTQQSKIFGKKNELEGRRKDGKLFPALVRVNPMRIDDEIYFSGVVDDISDTKILQTQLVQAQKLEAIGQLASGVAHEINTPIQYIGDNLSALRQNFNDILAYQNAITQLIPDDKRTELAKLAAECDIEFTLEDSPNAIQQSLEGVERVAEIVRAMKAFTHTEADQGKQLVNLHDALNSALTISRNSYKYLATVETDFSAEVGDIECYAGPLNQVFLNMIVNAAHAIEEKQPDAGLIRIATRKLGDMVDIQIQDNGPGIPKSIHDKVFNLFFTTKPVGKGTGQGLSMAHSIVVEKHRGKLFFETEQGLGTTFHIQLPIRQTQEP